jgi:predicted site-specific integrase-resolvase
VKQTKTPNWIREQEAAAMLNYKPRTLREYSKKGILSINFTTVRGKKYHYNRTDIE